MADSHDAMADAVGAYVLHLFALLRSDFSHLAGPSYLLPLLLMALPVFAWRCLRPGLGRGLLLLVSVALIAEAVIAGRSELIRHAEAAGNTWKKIAHPGLPKSPLGSLSRPAGR